MYPEVVKEYLRKLDSIEQAAALFVRSEVIGINYLLASQMGYSDLSRALYQLQYQWQKLEELQNFNHSQISKISLDFSSFLLHSTGEQIPFQIRLFRLVPDEMYVMAVFHHELEYELEYKLSKYDISQNTGRPDSILLFLNTLIDSIPNPVYYKNMRGVFIGCNKAFLDVFNIQRDFIIGKDTNDLPELILANIYHDVDMFVIREQKNETNEHKIRNHEGEILEFISYKSVFLNADKSVGGLVCIMVDVSHLKQARKYLKDSEIRLKLALEASNLGLWDLNLSRHTLYLSPEYYTLLGYMPDEFEPQINHWIKSFYNSDLEQINLLEGSFTQIRQRINSAEYRVQNKKGDWIWILLKGDIVEQHSKAREYRVTGTIRDITEAKGHEESSKENEERLKMISESSYDAIILIDEIGQITYHNHTAAILFGYEELEWTSGSIWNLITNASNEKLIKHSLMQMLHNNIKQNTLIDLELISKNGILIPCDVRIAAVLIRREINFVLTILDLTRQKKEHQERLFLETQLRHAQKLETIGTLAGGIAHDFNNILTPIIGFTQLAIDEIPEENMAHSDLLHVLKAAQRAKSLVKQILLFSRQLDDEKTAVFLHLIIKEVSELINASKPPTIKLELILSTKEAVVYASPTQIHQVLMNLLTNAIQAIGTHYGTVILRLEAMHSEGLLSLKHLPPAQYACIRVKDNGIGMDEITISRIFEPFFTTKPVGEGTGLGLSVAHGIIQSLGGHIEVESVLGEGSEFILYLPLSKSVELEETIKVDLCNQLNGNVLLIDDDVETGVTMKRMLEHMGCKVTLYTNPNTALQFLVENTEKFQVAITDYAMPHMMGDVFIKRARIIDEKCRFILYSGNIHLLKNIEELKHDRVEILNKPISMELLSEVLKKIFSNY